MASLQQIRDHVLYTYGYLQGRTFSLPTSLSKLNAALISKVSTFIALPLPLLSFFALPIFGGTSTSVNLVFFYLTWTALVLSHDPLTIELYGTLAVRCLFFLLPALGFLAFDCAVPGASKSIKAYGERQLPLRLERNKLLEITAVAVANVLLAVGLQAGLELMATEVFHLRSIIKITTTVPLPWNIAKDVLKGFALRGVVHYVVHRYLLHTYQTPLRDWHLRWQHSVRLPFSLATAYDHPVCYLLAQWLPVFLPAYLFRFHVLTYHIFVALVSLEELFINSGYAVLPSSIVLAGMARRTDVHFLAVSSESKETEACNFGHWGILDLVCGTSCKETADILDDFNDEAEKHEVKSKSAERGGRRSRRS